MIWREKGGKRKAKSLLICLYFFIIGPLFLSVGYFQLVILILKDVMATFIFELRYTDRVLDLIDMTFTVKSYFFFL